MTLGTNKRIDELFNKYVAKTITREEHAEFFAYIRNPETKDQVLTLMDDYNRKVQSEVSVHEIDWDVMYSKITSSTSTKRPVFFQGWRLVAASITLLVMCSVSIYIFNQSKGSKKGELVYHNDVKPAKDLAVLTLADGSEIVLDEKTRGEFAQQGDIAIERDQNGQIVYKVADVAQANAEQINTLATPAGGVFSVVLSDGSKVWLNASSSLKFPAKFLKNTREVEITGEAYFEIAKDAKKPFLVKNGSSKIQVLGTHFNVMAYPDEYKSRLTLLEGAVQFIKNSKKELLTPGNQLLYTETSNETTQVRADVEEVMAWRNNLFVFNNTSFDEVMKDLVRWYNVKIKYEGEKPDISFTGIIPRNSNVSDVLKALELTGDVAFGIENNVITCEKRK